MVYIGNTDGRHNMQTNRWNTIVTTADSSGWAIYINGTKVLTRSGAGNRKQGTLGIGKYYPYNSGMTQVGFYGKLKNCAMYNRVLTQTEITNYSF